MAVLAGLCLLPPASADRAEPQRSDAPSVDANAALQDLRLDFVPNAGQAPRGIRYEARGGGFTFGFARDRALISLAGETLALRFLGASPKTRLTVEREASGTVSYLRGNDPKRWQRGLPTYRKLAYRSLWPGIDMRLRGEDGKLKYEFLVEPGARAKDIALAYAGARSLSVGRGGDLLVETGKGVLEDSRPVAYQRRRRPQGGGRGAATSSLGGTRLRVSSWGHTTVAVRW